MAVKQVFNTSAELDYPTILPTLDLDFANSKTLDSRITFARSSGGSYVGADGFIKYAGVNEARFGHNPITGESLGLLVEEPRINSFQWSNSAINAETWNNVGTSMTLTSGQSDLAGGVTAIRAADVDNTSGGTFLQRTNVASASPLTTGATVTFSVWLKPIACPLNYISLNLLSNVTADTITANFDTAGSLITAVTTSSNGTGSAVAASFTAWPNGWYRCVLTGVPSTVTVADIRSRINLGSYQRVQGTARFDWYGAQLESGAFPTSYIPTIGSTRNRAADNASITGINFSEWYKQTEGTFYAEVFPAPTYVAFQAVANLQGAISTDEWRIWRSGTAQQSSTVLLSSTTEQLSASVAFATASNGSCKFATAAAANNMAIASSGKLASDNVGAMVTLTSLRIGARTNNTFYYDGHISRLTYWPKRLSNAQLQVLTR